MEVYSLRLQKIKLLGIIVLTILVLISGCSILSIESTEGVAAQINGEKITIEHIEKVLQSRRMVLEIGKGIYDNHENNLDMLVNRYNEQIKQTQSKAIKRYYERQKLQIMKQYYSENEAFNIVIRQVVLNQEAKKHGYKISLDEARQAKKIIDDNNKKAFEESQGSERYDKYRQLEEEVIKSYGFKSKEEWIEANLPFMADGIARSTMRRRFVQILMEKNRDVQGLEWHALKGNSWEEYKEYLLKNSKIKIYDDRFEIVYDENDWKYGRLNLRNE